MFYIEIFRFVYDSNNLFIITKYDRKIEAIITHPQNEKKNEYHIPVSYSSILFLSH